MNEAHSKEVLATCALLDFTKESHFMRRTFGEDEALVVYLLAPLANEEDYAAVIQYHSPDTSQPRADFYRDFDIFKEDLLGLVEEASK